MSTNNNPLDIKEKRLLEYYHELDNLFQLNNLNYEVEYTFEENKKLNSVLNYSIEINGIPRMGMATYVKQKRKFGGVVFKNEAANYFVSEGFDDKFIEEDAPIWAMTDKLDYFFAMLCVPILSELKFGDENS